MCPILAPTAVACLQKTTSYNYIAGRQRTTDDRKQEKVENCLTELHTLLSLRATTGGEAISSLAGRLLSPRSAPTRFAPGKRSKHGRQDIQFLTMTKEQDFVYSLPKG